MLETFRKLFESRKVQLALMGAIIWAGGKLGLDLAFEDVAPILGLIVAVIAGITIEDAAAKRAGATPVQPIRSGEAGVLPPAPPTAPTAIGEINEVVVEPTADPAEVATRPGGAP